MNNKLYYAYKRNDGTWLNVVGTLNPGTYANADLSNEVNRVLQVTFGSVNGNFTAYDAYSKCITITNHAPSTLKLFFSAQREYILRNISAQS